MEKTIKAAPTVEEIQATVQALGKFTLTEVLTVAGSHIKDDRKDKVEGLAHLIDKETTDKGYELCEIVMGMLMNMFVILHAVDAHNELEDLRQLMEDDDEEEDEEAAPPEAARNA